jgi:hypothetical protein
MTEEKTCMRCGSAKLAAGWVQSTGKVCFRPDKAKFIVPKTADVPVDGRMCLECGAIELVGDVKKARSLMKPIHPD